MQRTQTSGSLLRLVLDNRSAIKQGPAGLAQRRQARLAEMVTFARALSPYYRERYQELPARVEDTALLPITSKKELMASFDDWVTDREVTVEEVRAFVDNPELIGERFLGKYTALTTSGSTGIPGVFLLDDQTMAVTNALALRMLGSWISLWDLVRIVARLGRMTMVMATGGHFASAVAGARLRKRSGKRIQILSVHTPLAELVESLNRFRPAIVAPYASVASLLASEQEVGRLRINPVLLVLSAEGLPLGEYDRIASVFKAKVRHSYAATECPFLSYSCEHKWLHVNTDWVVLEPVDAGYQPTPPGEQSHTVLISNLANRVQPILRYDLGDSILVRPDLCPCGNPLPAIRVQGRSADVLSFRNQRGELVKIAPLAFGTVIDGVAFVERFQIIQTTPTNLRVRLRLADNADLESVCQKVQAEIAHLLSAHKLDGVTLERADEPPQQSPGGKYREVMPLQDS